MFAHYDVTKLILLNKISISNEYLELTQGNHFYRLLKNAVSSYRAVDLGNDIVGGSHINGFPIKSIPF